MGKREAGSGNLTAITVMVINWGSTKRRRAGFSRLAAAVERFVIPQHTKYIFTYMYRATTCKALAIPPHEAILPRQWSKCAKTTPQ